MAGQRRAKEGLRKMIGGLQQGVESLRAALAAYRMRLYHEGTEERGGEGAAGWTEVSFPLTRPPGTLLRDLRVGVFG